MLAWLLVCQRQSEKGKHCYSPTEAGGWWTHPMDLHKEQIRTFIIEGQQLRV